MSGATAADLKWMFSKGSGTVRWGRGSVLNNSILQDDEVQVLSVNTKNEVKGQPEMTKNLKKKEEPGL